MAKKQYSVLDNQILRLVQFINDSESFVSNARSVSYIIATDLLITDPPFKYSWSDINNCQAHVNKGTLLMGLSKFTIK